MIVIKFILGDEIWTNGNKKSLLSFGSTGETGNIILTRAKETSHAVSESV